MKIWSTGVGHNTVGSSVDPDELFAKLFFAMKFYSEKLYESALFFANGSIFATLCCVCERSKER